MRARRELLTDDKSNHIHRNTNFKPPCTNPPTLLPHHHLNGQLLIHHSNPTASHKRLKDDVKSRRSISQTRFPLLFSATSYHLLLGNSSSYSGTLIELAILLSGAALKILWGSSYVTWLHLSHVCTCIRPSSSK